MQGSYQTSEGSCEELIGPDTDILLKFRDKACTEGSMEKASGQRLLGLQ